MLAKDLIEELKAVSPDTEIYVLHRGGRLTPHLSLYKRSADIKEIECRPVPEYSIQYIVEILPDCDPCCKFCKEN